MASTIRRGLLALVDALTPGSQMILGRMMELLFVELLRRHASRLPEGSKGLLAALNDPLVGRALQLMHADPARRWTTDELAREAGSSRTVLGERFNALLGKPPIDYLTGWRIQLAADRLRNGHDTIARIAVDGGYEFGGRLQPRLQAGHRPDARPLADRRRCHCPPCLKLSERQTRSQHRAQRSHSSAVSRLALPPAAAVLIVTVCSVRSGADSSARRPSARCPTDRVPPNGCVPTTAPIMLRLT